MSDMTVQQVRDAKGRAEQLIASVLMELHKATGFIPNGVSVSATTAQRIEQRAPVLIEMKAQIDLGAI